MKTVRLIANFLFYLSRLGAFIILATCIYAIIMLLLAEKNVTGVPAKISSDSFEIYYPFTQKVFLLGDNTASYIVTNFFTFLFYGIFLWLLSNVFLAFRQEKLFTRKSVRRLSGFYIMNLLTPFLFGVIILLFKAEASDLTRIVFLHLVIGVFAFFMAAIFRQGLILQEEQDLTF